MARSRRQSATRASQRIGHAYQAQPHQLNDEPASSDNEDHLQLQHNRQPTAATVVQKSSPPRARNSHQTKKKVKKNNEKTSSSSTKVKKSTIGNKRRRHAHERVDEDYCDDSGDEDEEDDEENYDERVSSSSGSDTDDILASSSSADDDDESDDDNNENGDDDRYDDNDNDDDNEEYVVMPDVDDGDDELLLNCDRALDRDIERRKAMTIVGGGNRSASVGSSRGSSSRSANRDGGHGRKKPKLEPERRPPQQQQWQQQRQQQQQQKPQVVREVKNTATTASSSSSSSSSSSPSVQKSEKQKKNQTRVMAPDASNNNNKNLVAAKHMVNRSLLSKPTKRYDYGYTGDDDDNGHDDNDDDDDDDDNEGNNRRKSRSMVLDMKKPARSTMLLSPNTTRASSVGSSSSSSGGGGGDGDGNRGGIVNFQPGTPLTQDEMKQLLKIRDARGRASKSGERQIMYSEAIKSIWLRIIQFMLLAPDEDRKFKNDFSERVPNKTRKWRMEACHDLCTRMQSIIKSCDLSHPLPVQVIRQTELDSQFQVLTLASMTTPRFDDIFNFVKGFGVFQLSRHDSTKDGSSNFSCIGAFDIVENNVKDRTIDIRVPLSVKFTPNQCIRLEKYDIDIEMYLNMIKVLESNEMTPMTPKYQLKLGLKLKSETVDEILKCMHGGNLVVHGDTQLAYYLRLVKPRIQKQGVAIVYLPSNESIERLKEQLIDENVHYYDGCQKTGQDFPPHVNYVICSLSQKPVTTSRPVQFVFVGDCHNVLDAQLYYIRTINHPTYGFVLVGKSKQDTTENRGFFSRCILEEKPNVVKDVFDIHRP